MNDKREIQRRVMILEAAQNAFSKKGYAATTIDEIATAAGLSKGSIYNYFKNKQDLFTQLFLTSIGEDEAQTDAVVAQSTPASEKLTAILDMWFSRFSKYQQIGRLVLEFWGTAARQNQNGTFVRVFEELYDRYRDRLCRILRQGQQDGQFKLKHPPEVGASLIMAMVDGLSLHSIMGVRTVDQQSIAAIKDSVLRALEGPTADRQEAAS
jgi:AcrR family transcriptional regulator